MQNNYKEAFDLIFSTKDIDDKINIMKEEFLKAYDCSQLKSLPMKYKIEKTLVQAINKR